MQEFAIPDKWLEGLKHELDAIARRKKALKSLTNFQGYSLKTIKVAIPIFTSGRPWDTPGPGGSVRATLISREVRRQ